MATIKWYGHAAFRIEAANGSSLITDPYTPDLLGYAPMRDRTNVVAISSTNDRAHCRADLIDGDPVVFDALAVARSGGSAKVGGIGFQAIEAKEWVDHPEHEAGANAMYRWEMDGIRFAHMGDVGNPLGERQMAFLEDVDVLFALAGGYLTIELPDLMEAIRRTRPKLVVPMHFRTLTYKPRNTLWVESFLSGFDEDAIDFACAHEITLRRGDLSKETRVMVMDYAR